MRKIYLILIQVITLILFGLFYSCSNNTSTNRDSYQEKVLSVEEIERLKPTDFLMVSATYNENFWGDKIKIHGVIKNLATVATYKDAIIDVIYYTKTNTELRHQSYTIYEFFPPHSEVKFELKAENYANVGKVKFKILQAATN